MERRRAQRRVPGASDPLAQVRLRVGATLSVLNVSDLGALVEGVSRFLPGAQMDLHVMTRGEPILVRARILRSSVATLSAKGIVYRGAMSFDRPVDTSTQTPAAG